MKITAATAMKSMFTFLALNIMVGAFMVLSYGTQTETQFTITFLALIVTIAGFFASLTALDIIED